MIFVVGTKRVLGTDTVKYYQLPEHLIKYKLSYNHKLSSFSWSFILATVCCCCKFMKNKFSLPHDWDFWLKIYYKYLSCVHCTSYNMLPMRQFDFLLCIIAYNQVWIWKLQPCANFCKAILFNPHFYCLDIGAMV